jgi:hypothetical protein
MESSDEPPDLDLSPEELVRRFHAAQHKHKPGAQKRREKREKERLKGQGGTEMRGAEENGQGRDASGASKAGAGAQRAGQAGSGEPDATHLHESVHASTAKPAPASDLGLAIGASRVVGGEPAEGGSVVVMHGSSSSGAGSVSDLALSERLVLTEMALARVACRAGWLVLAYRLKPDEPGPSGARGPNIVTVSLPEGAGQLVFTFADQHAPLLAGIARSSVYPVHVREVVSADVERLVRAMVSCWPGTLENGPPRLWDGTDGSPETHAKMLVAL